MVEYNLSLDTIFASLSDPTRRDILQRVSEQELSVGEIAEPYNLTFAAISKHLQVLEKAKLIIKRRQGKQHYVQASPVALKEATDYLERYQRLWDERFDLLEELIRNPH